MTSREIYCGNNLYDVGNRRVGSPYECLKKGVGLGFNSDLRNYNPRYQSIIPDNTYCGTGNPPMGKEMGTPTGCLRKGVGIGKKLQYNRYIEDGADDWLNESRPLIPRPFLSPNVKQFLMKWWPVILALLAGVIALLFRATYTTALLLMIATLVAGWFVHSVMKPKID